MIVVTVYIEKGNQDCDQVIADLADLQENYPHKLAVVDIDQDPDIKSNYQGIVPVVAVGVYKLHHPFTRQDLQVALGAAQDRAAQLDKIGDEKYEARIERGRTVSGADRFSYWLTGRYLLIVNVLMLLYAGLPFLAPVLAKAGADLPANVIYTIYKPFCHQLSFRSFFLFGEQAFYPRQLAGVSGVGTYEQFFGDSTLNLASARAFTGIGEIGAGVGRIGYKVALCERDVAIYGSLFLFGVVFALTRRKIKPLPWYWWVAIGIIPIGIDGASQLPSLLNIFPQWMLIRESTPVLRVLTGALFGIATAWYLFPLIEESMRETRKLLAGKMAVVAQIQQS